MVSSLPMALRVYRRLSTAMVPLAPALIKRRLKLGKEDPARIAERLCREGIRAGEQARTLVPQRTCAFVLKLRRVAVQTRTFAGRYPQFAEWKVGI